MPPPPSFCTGSCLLLMGGWRMKCRRQTHMLGVICFIKVPPKFNLARPMPPRILPYVPYRL